MQSNPGKIFVQSLFLQQNAEKAAAQSPVQRPSSGCASRSRTYDGGVKVPCLTAWRWRIMQNSIAYFPPFHKRCAAFFAAFSMRCLLHLRRFSSLAAEVLRFPHPSLFLQTVSFAGCVFQKAPSAGAQNSSCKGKIYFFLIFLIIFSKDCIFCCGSGTLDVIKTS